MVSAAKRTRLDPQQRRRQLIDIGTRIVAESGMDAVTVEGVAKQAGTSSALLFHYFGSRDGFRVALVRHACEELLALTEPDPRLSNMALLHDLMTRYVDYVTSLSSAYQTLLRGSTSADPTMAAIVEHTRAVATQRVLDRLPAIPGLDPHIVELAVHAWVAFIEDATLTWLKDPKITREQLIGLHVHALPGILLTFDTPLETFGELLDGDRIEAHTDAREP